MSANLPQTPSIENVSTTLSSGITDSAGTMSVADASNIVSPCYLVIDRVDAAGALKNTSLWEYVKVTNVAGNDLTITRAQGGSTGQSHSSGAVVEAVITAAHFEDWYNALNPEHTASGGHIIGTATITTHLQVAGASISGIGLNPTWYIPTLPSNATTALGRPMAIPRAGTAQFVSITANSIISSPSVYFDVNKNFVSMFSAGTRPLLANTTFVSTASLSVKNFKAGDVMSVDLDWGGNASVVMNQPDIYVTLSSY